VAGVEGVVLMAGGPMASPYSPSPRPWPGAVVLAHEGGLSGAVVAQTKAARDGTFRIDLPPGEYTLIARSFGATPERITVASDGRVTVKLYIHVP
jgi:hypothetical protein